MAQHMFCEAIAGEQKGRRIAGTNLMQYVRLVTAGLFINLTYSLPNRENKKETGKSVRNILFLFY